MPKLDLMRNSQCQIIAVGCVWVEPDSLQEWMNEQNTGINYFWLTENNNFYQSPVTASYMHKTYDVASLCEIKHSKVLLTIAKEGGEKFASL